MFLLGCGHMGLVLALKLPLAAHIRPILMGTSAWLLQQEKHWPKHWPKHKKHLVLDVSLWSSPSPLLYHLNGQSKWTGSTLHSELAVHDRTAASTLGPIGEQTVSIPPTTLSWCTPFQTITRAFQQCSCDHCLSLSRLL